MALALMTWSGTLGRLTGRVNVVHDAVATTLPSPTGGWRFGRSGEVQALRLRPAVRAIRTNCHERDDTGGP
ncbi:hypothetical protein GCM10010972_16340 [Cellulomonas carbonis]|uniref:Uncharacterized protein n=1 Tax=Cellulomonas carbonis T26 TaxID=947969 RepID=A0A0A0BXI8_9CELL|nr:hypothetical protein N868_15085 [Cellulomonas carbonis T26]GGC03962.1 hypothetical protein GCM10010972_16340 [Cellulomonas carbonis]